MADKENPVVYTFPDTIGGCLKLLATTGKTIDRAEAKLKPLHDKEKALREFMLNKFKKDDLRAAKGSGISISVVQTTSPVIKDWVKFFAFCKRKGNEDLLTRKCSSTAWRERLEDGKAVPGIEVYNGLSLRVNKDKGKEKG